MSFKRVVDIWAVNRRSILLKVGFDSFIFCQLINERIQNIVILDLGIKKMVKLCVFSDHTFSGHAQRLCANQIFEFWLLTQSTRGDVYFYLNFTWFWERVREQVCAIYLHRWLFSFSCYTKYNSETVVVFKEYLQIT